MNYAEARAAFQADRGRLEHIGIVTPSILTYTPEEFKYDYRLALDSMPELAMDATTIPAIQTSANAGVPWMLTTMIDPAVFEILFAPNKAAIIFGENKKGTWLDQTTMFPTVEHVGETTSYGDFQESGHVGVNTNWPQRQAYLYQTVKEYGELELERAGLARINWVSEIDKASATTMNKFQNFTYFFGVGGLQNYGLLNDPSLSAALTPATKAAGGTKWISGGAIVATANEIYADIQALYYQLVQQTGGLVDAQTRMVLALSPTSEVALTATNSFNVNVHDLLKKNFPNIRIESAVQYGLTNTQNPQGFGTANLVQLFAESVEGQDTGYCAFNEKMRSHPIIRAMSSFRQKVTGGTWGAVIRMPVNIAQMIGI